MFIENLSISKAVNLNTKITTLANKFNQQISAIKKPFFVITTLELFNTDYRPKIYFKTYLMFLIFLKL